MSALGDMTSAVQFGFIIGTLVYAALLLADRFSPSRVFLVSAILGALFNLGVGSLAADYNSILLMRFLTGFFLAGIYPVGMKIASDWYEAGLGKALGYLVGALVLGTAFPHLLRYTAAEIPWQRVIQGTSAIAVLGGVAIWLLVPDGPYQRRGSRLKPQIIMVMFRQKRFRAAAFGYFGHMWELYAFWAFVPVILSTGLPELIPARVSLYSFGVIGIGALGCILGGYWSLKKGSALVAVVMLLISALLCVASPWLFEWAAPVFLSLLLLWGFTVVGDSPQFSTLVAQYAPPEYRGSALTIVNCLGFAITIFSIQLLKSLMLLWEPTNIYWVLVFGPVLGLWSMRRLIKE
jgi:MFS family permease